MTTHADIMFQFGLPYDTEVTSTKKSKFIQSDEDTLLSLIGKSKGLTETKKFFTELEKSCKKHGMDYTEYCFEILQNCQLNSKNPLFLIHKKFTDDDDVIELYQFIYDIIGRKRFYQLCAESSERIWESTRRYPLERCHQTVYYFGDSLFQNIIVNKGSLVLIKFFYEKLGYDILNTRRGFQCSILEISIKHHEPAFDYFSDKILADTLNKNYQWRVFKLLPNLMQDPDVENIEHWPPLVQKLYVGLKQLLVFEVDIQKEPVQVQLESMKLQSGFPNREKIEDKLLKIEYEKIKEERKNLKNQLNKKNDDYIVVMQAYTKELYDIANEIKCCRRNIRPLTRFNEFRLNLNRNSFLTKFLNWFCKYDYKDLCAKNRRNQLYSQHLKKYTCSKNFFEEEKEAFVQSFDAEKRRIETLRSELKDKLKQMKKKIELKIKQNTSETTSSHEINPNKCRR